jgi:hypothetical protein
MGYSSFQELWRSTQFLARYGRIPPSDARFMSFREREFRLKQVREWIKDENEEPKGRQSSSPQARVTRGGRRR